MAEMQPTKRKSALGSRDGRRRPRREDDVSRANQERRKCYKFPLSLVLPHPGSLCSRRHLTRQNSAARADYALDFIDFLPNSIVHPSTLSIIPKCTSSPSFSTTSECLHLRYLARLLMCFLRRLRHPWSHVVIGMWHKYPNPHCSHVVTVDTLSRTIDPKTGIVRTERVLGCKQKAPTWIVKVSPNPFCVVFCQRNFCSSSAVQKTLLSGKYHS